MSSLKSEKLKKPKTNKKFWKSVLVLVLLLLAVTIALRVGWNMRLVTAVAFLIGLSTQAFAALLGIIALIPWVGPAIVTLLSVPLFWLINAVGHLLSIIAVRKGYGKEVASSKVLVLVLSIGIILGYLIGYLTHA